MTNDLADKLAARWSSHLSSAASASSRAIRALVVWTTASLVSLLVPSGHSASIVPARDPLRSWSRLNSEPLHIAASLPLAQLLTNAPFLKQEAVCPQWAQKTRPPALYSLCDCQFNLATHRGSVWGAPFCCRKVPRLGKDLIHSELAARLCSLLRFRLAAASAVLL